MITALVLGAGCGLGLWALAVWLFPPRPALGAVLARAIAPTAPAPLRSGQDSRSDSGSDTGWVVARLGGPLVAPLRAMGLPGQRLAQVLAVTGRPIEVHLAQKAAIAIAGLLAPLMLPLPLALAGLFPGIEFPVVAGLAMSAGGFVLPDLRARSAAAKLRAGFRHALSAYLDLVWITVAGGAGVDSALSNAASVGRGWAFDQIRRGLDAARLTRTTPWAGLRRLGEELDVTELVELAATIGLAGTEGAQVRASLAAKATALRTRRLTDTEGEAHAATERMSLPVMALFLGFLVFITYPALTQVLSGL